MELRNALSQAFGIELSATVTFDHPTVVALAGHVAGGQIQTIDGFSCVMSALVREFASGRCWSQRPCCLALQAKCRPHSLQSGFQMTAARLKNSSQCCGSGEPGILHAHRPHRSALTNSRQSTQYAHCLQMGSYFAQAVDVMMGVVGRGPPRCQRVLPCTNAPQGVLAEVLAAASASSAPLWQHTSR